MDSAQEPSCQQGRTLPTQPLRQDPPQAGTAYVYHYIESIQIAYLFLVKQERIKAKGGKKAKAPKAAGEAFLKTLFAA